MREYRVGIIGTGNIAGLNDMPDSGEVILSHARAIALHPRLRLAAVSDPDTSRVNAFVQTWSVPLRYIYYQDLLQAALDIVVICTPDCTHATIAQAAAQSNISLVICEKPLATVLADGEQVVAAFDRSGIPFTVNYQRRWDIRHRALAQMIRSGELGAVQHVRALYVRGLLHNGTHALDLLNWWCGKVVSVQPIGVVNGYSDDDPSVSAILKFKNGATGLLQAIDAQKFHIFEIDVVGTRGRIQVADFGQTVRAWRVAPNPLYNGDPDLIPQPFGDDLEPFGRALYRMWDNVVDVLDGRAALTYTGTEALEALRLASQLKQISKSFSKR